MTKTHSLLMWCKMKGIFSYVDVQHWKEQNFYLRADRTIRDFVSKGLIRRIPDEESVLRGLRKPGNANLAFFENIS